MERTADSGVVQMDWVSGGNAPKFRKQSGRLLDIECDSAAGRYPYDADLSPETSRPAISLGVIGDAKSAFAQSGIWNSTAPMKTPDRP